MKKIIPLTIVIFINILALWYLLSPAPAITPLPHSVKSMLPGDTTQLSHVSAYYTDSRRADVINFYKNIYNSPLRIIINHPPERSKVIFTNTMQSYYLEEFIIPFKESLYINGFEWENDVFTKPEKREKNKLEYGDIIYNSKVTTRTFTVPILNRLISLFALEALFVFLFLIYRQFFRKK